MDDWIDEFRKKFDPAIISTNENDLLLHSYDCWPVAYKLRQQNHLPYKPDVVVRARYTEEVSQILAWAHSYSIPVTPWGAGSGVTGAALPTHGGISLDMSSMNAILAFDPFNHLVEAQAGLIGSELEHYLNERGYTLNHSPQSLDRSTIGGWVATGASGQFSSRWGGIEELIIGLAFVLSDGQLIRSSNFPRASVGPNLKHLLIGSEGIFGVITQVTLKIFPIAPHRIFDTFHFPRIENGLSAMRKIIQGGLRPFLARLYDSDEAHLGLGIDPGSGCVLMLGFEGMENVARAEYEEGRTICEQEDSQTLGPGICVRWMERRFDFSMIENKLNQEAGFAETIEIANYWDRIVNNYYDLKKGLAPYADNILGHFSHIYPQGTSLYLIILGQAEDAESAKERLTSVWNVAMKICFEHGAAISHHHGVGLVRSPFVRQALASNYIVLERIKNCLDPVGILNPGKFGL